MQEKRVREPLMRGGGREGEETIYESQGEELRGKDVVGRKEEGSCGREISFIFLY